METFGSIIDKICILERRIKELKNKGEKFYHLYDQYGWLLYSLGEYLQKSFKGEMPFTFEKNKSYDKDVNVDDNISFLDAIIKLNECNNKLWDLEDIRRDLSLPDDKRLKAADDVSVYNKLRNDSMDRIDQNIEKYARFSHNKNFTGEVR